MPLKVLSILRYKLCNQAIKPPAIKNAHINKSMLDNLGHTTHTDNLAKKKMSQDAVQILKVTTHYFNLE